MSMCIRTLFRIYKFQFHLLSPIGSDEEVDRVLAEFQEICITDPIPLLYLLPKDLLRDSVV